MSGAATVGVRVPDEECGRRYDQAGRKRGSRYDQGGERRRAQYIIIIAACDINIQ